MNKRLLASAGFILCVLFLPLQTESSSLNKFQLNIRTGISYLLNMEYFHSVKSEDEHLAAANLGPGFLSVDHDYSVMRIAPEYRIEALYRLTSRFSIGLSFGYLRKTWELEGEYQALNSEPGLDPSEFRTAHRYALSVYPLNLTLRYHVFDIGSATSVHIMGGINVYRLSWEDDSILDRSFKSSFTGRRVRTIEAAQIYDAKSNDCGFEIGLELERRISSRLSLTGAWIFGVGRNPDIRGNGLRYTEQYSDGQFDFDWEERFNPPTLTSLSMNRMNLCLGLRIRL